MNPKHYYANKITKVVAKIWKYPKKNQSKSVKHTKTCSALLLFTVGLAGQDQEESRQLQQWCASGRATANEVTNHDAWQRAIIFRCQGWELRSNTVKGCCCAHLVEWSCGWSAKGCDCAQWSCNAELVKIRFCFAQNYMVLSKTKPNY